MIPYGRQKIELDDIAAVTAALSSDFLTQGPKVPEFEQSIAAKVGAAHSLAFNSATSALHAACNALGVGPGDTVWTTPISFVASANCALYCGAEVDFVDIDRETVNICPISLEKKLVWAKANHRLPKALVAVHFAGEPVHLERIAQLCAEYGVKLIEDASHALGAKYGGIPIGSCAQSTICIFSFHPVKIITTLEGGLATTNDPDLARSLSLFRSHGITRNEEWFEGPSHGPWYYEQVGLGYNYRMTDVQAALGLSQHAKLNAFLERRHEIASIYDKEFGSLELTCQLRNPISYSALHLYIVQLPIDLRKQRRKFFETLRTSGIGVNVHYIPIYRQPYYLNRYGSKILEFPNAEQYYEGAVTLPIHPSMTEADVEKVVISVKNAMKAI